MWNLWNTYFKRHNDINRIKIWRYYAYSKTKNQQEAEILLDRIVKRKKSIMKRIDILKEEISKERQKQINKTNYIEQTKNHKVHK